MNAQQGGKSLLGLFGRKKGNQGEKTAATQSQAATEFNVPTSGKPNQNEVRMKE